jgi:hypothetical protein
MDYGGIFMVVIDGWIGGIKAAWNSKIYLFLWSNFET